nr:unnamed protein product [Callosobruchus analis]
MEENRKRFQYTLEHSRGSRCYRRQAYMYSSTS